MLSLPDGTGWAPIITGRVFASQGLLSKLWGSLCLLLGHEFFSFCGHVQHCCLSIIDLAYSQKQSITDHVE